MCAVMSISTGKKWLTRFLFMQKASCTAVNSVCHLLEGEAIDAALSVWQPVEHSSNSQQKGRNSVNTEKKHN